MYKFFKNNAATLTSGAAVAAFTGVGAYVNEQQRKRLEKENPGCKVVETYTVVGGFPATKWVLEPNSEPENSSNTPMKR